MHEMGIVLHLAKTLDETAKEQRLSKIGRVTLQVGEVSGIMTDLFSDCWNYFKVRHPVLRESELIIETLPAVTFCDGCRQTFETVKHGRICPFCGSAETWLVKGNECIIKEIEAEEAPDSPPESTSENTPESTPESTPEDTPENTPENTPESTSENTSESTPESTPEDTSESTPESTPEDTSESGT